MVDPRKYRRFSTSSEFSGYMKELDLYRRVYYNLFHYLGKKCGKFRFSIREEVENVFNENTCSEKVHVVLYSHLPNGRSKKFEKGHPYKVYSTREHNFVKSNDILDHWKEMSRFLHRNMCIDVGDETFKTNESTELAKGLFFDVVDRTRRTSYIRLPIIESLGSFVMDMALQGVDLLRLKARV